MTGIIGGVLALCIAVSPADAKRRSAAAKSAGGYNPPYADMVVDVKTGKILHATNPDALRHPASITKVMTLYLLFEQLDRGSLSLSSRLRVSANAAKQPPSKLGVKAGQTISVEDSIKALVTRSANDVAVVIAENLGGSESAFANMMTKKARALGMSRTTYRNASGLPNPGQITTARDLTVLARAIQDRFPRYYGYFQTRSFEYGNQVIGNHNRLLGRIDGVDGIKTGYTRASGFNLMTNAKTSDRHVVAVVLGGKSSASRDNIMASLVTNGISRAYAGARQTPVVAEAATTRRKTTVASADLTSVQEDAVDTTASTSLPPARPRIVATNTAPRANKQVRAVVASASTSADIPTASTKPNMRWKTGAQSAVPATANAYAAPAPEQQSELTKMLAQNGGSASKAEARVKVSGWVIQLGASDSEDKAKDLLSKAKTKTGKALAKASPFTEKVNASGSILYRARFSGFTEQADAQNACKTLKQNGFACFASRG
ncbi:D-alanyl-D-alanine carboxypeptidase [Microvirga sp. W0021]|uniref:D-alanyl-D-alanine carboxypeptidase n=1 Tax=Hohaiivirga grylli TaxID=3133970 RepID=A0ABV0BKA5_9HYPH